MKNIILILLLILSVNLFSQDTTITNQEHAFDFWVGNWTGYYYGKDSAKTNVKNNIIKTLDGKVIQENFEDPSNKFKGTSISVYNPKNKTWHQAWADNQGGYFNFIGELNDNKRIFKTIPKEVKGKLFIQRMVFHNITKNAFTWDWESSVDNGKTWKLNWQLFYEKIQ
jgi:hypothetical protein